MVNTLNTFDVPYASAFADAKAQSSHSSLLAYTPEIAVAALAASVIALGTALAALFH